VRFIRALVIAVVIVIATSATAMAVVKDNLAASPPITFSDGSTATAIDHCGDADLCATIEYQNGDRLFIYSEGAAYCQPYMLHVVKTHLTSTLYEFTRTLNHDPVVSNAFGVHCGNNQATQMTLDHGLVHLTVDEYTDGSLRFIFSQTPPPKH
jgi:hypothetical protein